MVTMVTCLYPSMIFSVGVSLLGGATAYYIALAWSTAAIAYFEVSIHYIFIDNCHGY